MLLTLAFGAHRGVDAEQQRPEAGRLGAGDRLFDLAPIAPHVQLEPQRRVRLRGYILDRGSSQGGESIRDAGMPGGAGHRQLALVMEHSRRADR